MSLITFLVRLENPFLIIIIIMCRVVRRGCVIAATSRDRCANSAGDYDVDAAMTLPQPRWTINSTFHRKSHHTRSLTHNLYIAFDRETNRRHSAPSNIPSEDAPSLCIAEKSGWHELATNSRFRFVSFIVCARSSLTPESIRLIRHTCLKYSTVAY